MSSPPVDPWSAQPEHGPPHNPPAQPGPPPPGDWPTAHYPTAPQGGGWPGPAQPGHPYAGQPPAPPSGGYPNAPTSGGYPPPPASGGYPNAPTSGGYPNAPTSGGYPVGSYPAAAPGGQPPTAGYPAVGADPTQPYPGFQNGPYGPPPAPPKKSRLPLVLTLGLVGLLVLCLGGGGLAWVALGDDEPAPRAGGAPAPSDAPAPTRGATPAETDDPTAEPSPSETEEDELGQVRLVIPKTLAGRAKSTDPTLRKLADQTTRDMKSDVTNETGAVSAFYGSPARRNMVMMAGASGPVLSPEKELDDALKGLGATLAVKKTTPVSPGPLGGVARCGDGKASGISLGVCAWADHGSVGVLVLYFSSASKAKAEFVTMRGQIEKPI
ncbi:hypothetical protein ACFY3U_25125 [Micromonospora sp. NPDC000089]|uniref:hypothetical protein n=1 Tax=unclassified Micromonospora TaxID=2617518 RepID=UPI003697CAED